MSSQSGYRTLHKLDPLGPHTFSTPSKCINDGEQDVPFFHTSMAYIDITTFLLQLNISMFPQKSPDNSTPITFPLNSSSVSLSPTVRNLQSLLSNLASIIDEIPPDPGPRRFGNISFRRWHDKVAERSPALLNEYLPSAVLDFPADPSSGVLARDELQRYFLGSLGSPQRLDYGTGHELSFLAFLGGIWKLGGFENAEPGVEQRGIVIGVIEPYLRLIRRLIVAYTLEPAGSHGVWGLDDHFFLPYIFGSAQLAPPIPQLSSDFKAEQLPQEGSLPGAPAVSDVTKQEAVQREREKNMYFSAIGFIYDVKKGPFWEHSPILYDVSGITTGWAKVNKGMLKMYNVEVLSKFPVVQHFPFGSLFRWERDPNAPEPASSVHNTSQPTRTPATTALGTQLHQAHARMESAARIQQELPIQRMAVPDVNPMGGTQAPWATTINPYAQMAQQPPMASVPYIRQEYPTQAPRTAQQGTTLDARVLWTNSNSSKGKPADGGGMPPTRAPLPER
ncbi:Phosphotyrosyl phosphatase activator [Rhizodiscina lignyota]|uniref:Serine/threonine-protein phosphatase 2A activator n=1 Tax=Rhizodiscina lignyota TaxID=1504668 RepID=A0A9P4M8C0_9PEZI|nr:Phosphotyrosyl phosphatase activator [Rhizodiscina lignyota]